MCGGTMRLKRSETLVRVPGNPLGTKSAFAEWICPECDYFEEAEEEKS